MSYYTNPYLMCKKEYTLFFQFTDNAHHAGSTFLPHHKPILDLQVSATTLYEALTMAWTKIAKMYTHCADIVTFVGALLPLYYDSDEITLLHKYYNCTVESKIASLMIENIDSLYPKPPHSDEYDGIINAKKYRKLLIDKYTRQMYTKEGASEVYKDLLWRLYQCEPQEYEVFLYEYLRGILILLQQENKFEEISTLAQYMQDDNVLKLTNFFENGSSIEGVPSCQKYVPTLYWNLNEDYFLCVNSGASLLGDLEPEIKANTARIIDGDKKTVSQLLNQYADMRAYAGCMNTLIEKNEYETAWMIGDRLLECRVDINKYIKPDLLIPFQNWKINKWIDNNEIFTLFNNVPHRDAVIRYFKGLIEAEDITMLRIIYHSLSGSPYLQRNYFEGEFFEGKETLLNMILQ